MQRRMEHTKGQSTLEYCVLIAVVISAILAMQIYSKRAVEGRFRQSSDQIGSQWDPAVGKYTVKISNFSERAETLNVTGQSTSTIQTKVETQKREAVAGSPEEVAAPGATEKLF